MRVPARVLQYVDSLTRRPEKDDTVLKPQQERILRSQFATREESSLRQLQSEQEKDLDALENTGSGEFDPQFSQKQTTIKQKYDSLRQDLHGRMVQEAGSMGIDLESPMATKAPRKAPSGGSGNDRVTVTGPDGTPGTVPRAQLQKALKRGYRLSSNSVGGGVN